MANQKEPSKVNVLHGGNECCMNSPVNTKYSKSLVEESSAVPLANQKEPVNVNVLHGDNECCMNTHFSFLGSSNNLQTIICPFKIIYWDNILDYNLLQFFSF